MTPNPNFKLSEDYSYSLIRFGSGEIQVKLDDPTYFTALQGHAHPHVLISGSILCSSHVMELLQLVEAIRYYGPELTLYFEMPYCAYSRQDRRCNAGESFSLKVFADLINSCNFAFVTTYDNHSDVATALIHNCRNISVYSILSEYEDYATYDFLVSPDAGANKKVFKCSYHFDIPMIRADKLRDTSTGNILETQVYYNSEQLLGRKVLIVDDICAGGRTFIELAKALKAKEPNVEIHLYVTHGFFHRGFDDLEAAGISKVITTNSVYDDVPNEYVTVLDTEKL